MKKIIILLIGLFFSSLIFAQQESRFTQFMHTKMIVNPGYAGQEEFPSITLFYRNQWMGFEGAPKAILGTFSTRMFKERVGFGLSIANYSKGIMNSWYSSMAYSYNLKFTDDVNLRVGLHATLRYLGIEFSDPSVVVTESDDAAILQGENADARKYKGNVGLGMYFTYKEFYAGISVPRFYPNFIGIDELNSISGAQERRHFYFMTGMTFPVTYDLSIRPALLVKLVSGSPLDVDLNVTAIFKKTLETGVSYRHGGSGSGESVDLNVLYQINNQIGVGFAYDFTLTDIKDTSHGSLEAMVKINLIPEEKDLSNPRFFE